MCILVSTHKCRWFSHPRYLYNCHDSPLSIISLIPFIHFLYGAVLSSVYVLYSPRCTFQSMRQCNSSVIAAGYYCWLFHGPGCAVTVITGCISGSILGCILSPPRGGHGTYPHSPIPLWSIGDILKSLWSISKLSVTAVVCHHTQIGYNNASSKATPSL